jgi:hypothetical protein
MRIRDIRRAEAPRRLTEDPHISTTVGELSTVGAASYFRAGDPTDEVVPVGVGYRVGRATADT